ncbi:fibroin heavy chain-like [Chrysoperla carnea]|uniref:fibroin heavy chain-like n=1 Tax=Chrysoperla carnea TaxID=189513 RepID=UPI001D060B50|nr:fibroin heavy chain-like [Chrysoperla carnea]
MNSRFSLAKILFLFGILVLPVYGTAEVGAGAASVAPAAMAKSAGLAGAGGVALGAGSRLIAARVGETTAGVASTVSAGINGVALRTLDNMAAISSIVTGTAILTDELTVSAADMVDAVVARGCSEINAVAQRAGGVAMASVQSGTAAIEREVQRALQEIEAVAKETGAEITNILEVSAKLMQSLTKQGVAGYTMVDGMYSSLAALAEHTNNLEQHGLTNMMDAGITYLSATEEVCAAGGGLALGSGLATRGAIGAGAAGSALAAGAGAARTAAGAATGAAVSSAVAAGTGAAERMAGAAGAASVAAADRAGATTVAAAGARLATATLTDAARKVALQIVASANSAASVIDAADADSNAAIRKAAKAIDGVASVTIRDLQKTVDTIVLGLQGSVKKTTSQLNMALDSAIIGVGSDLLAVVATAEQTVARVGRNVAGLIREAAGDIARQVVSTSVGVASSIGGQSLKIAAVAEGARQDVRASQAGMRATAGAANAHYGTGIPIIP